MEQSEGRSNALSLHFGVVAIEKEPSGRPRLRSPTLLFYMYDEFLLGSKVFTKEL